MAKRDFYGLYIYVFAFMTHNFMKRNLKKKRRLLALIIIHEDQGAMGSYLWELWKAVPEMTSPFANYSQLLYILLYLFYS